MTTENIILTKNGLTVTIDTNVDTENLTKSLTLLTPPKSTNNQDSDPDAVDYGPNNTLILDILSKVEQRVTVTGYLSTGTVSGDSSSTAQGRKNDLKNIFLGGGTAEMTYEGVSNITVGIEKLEIRRVERDGQTPQNGEVEYNIQMTLIRGINMTGG